MYLLTNERYIAYQTGFSFGRLVHAKGWDLGYCGGGGGGHLYQHNSLGPTPPGASGRGQKFNFLNMVMWHIKFKGMSSRPGYTEKF